MEDYHRLYKIVLNETKEYKDKTEDNEDESEVLEHKMQNPCSIATIKCSEILQCLNDFYISSKVHLKLPWRV